MMLHCYDLVTHSILRLQVTSQHFTFESFYLMGVDALVFCVSELVHNLCKIAPAPTEC